MDNAQLWIDEGIKLIAYYTPKVLAALVILIIGWYLIKKVLRVIDRVMEKREYDLSLRKFLHNLASWALKIFLIVTVVSTLGIETTSLAAVIAAAGLAIGLALQGSLSNFAGGVLIMVFKPYKIGDFIEAQGVKGTVKEIEIFTTKLNTFENRLAIVPNGQLANGNIINYSAEENLRLELVVGVGYGEKIDEVRATLQDIIQADERILADPAPQILVKELASSSVNFGVRMWTFRDNYWPLNFDLTEQVKKTFDAKGIEIPYPHQVEIHKQE
ncbi:mechanosensitive ion channel [Gangjinia marincola]|uniref:Mechanosensitive ion channel n=1 Tax=Gangjinia marincola TaxID=578463 RepID=A0ABN1MJ90_9FLAO